MCPTMPHRYLPHKRTWTPTRWSYWNSFYHTYHTGTYHTRELGPLPGGATGAATVLPHLPHRCIPHKRAWTPTRWSYWSTTHNTQVPTEPGPLLGGATGAATTTLTTQVPYTQEGLDQVELLEQLLPHIPQRYLTQKRA